LLPFSAGAKSIGNANARHWHGPAVSDHSRVIVRVFIILAFLALAGWVDAATLYADKTDKELTDLAAGWSGLSEDQRRALLTEIKARMQTNTNKRPVLTIKTERRYGRIVRQPDGSLLRIETTEHIVRYQRLPEDASDQPFGVGFEQRSVTSDAEAVAPGTDQAPPSAPETMTTSATPIKPPVIPVGSANNH
jgi:hypothetical protein